MDWYLIICQVAGILLLAGVISLLFFRRVVLDGETKSPTSFKFPLLGELKTQTPVLVLVVVGAAMVAYPLSQRNAPTVSVSGQVTTERDSVSVLVIADPDYTHTYDTSSSFTFELPLLNSNAKYRVKYIVNKLVVKEEPVTPHNGKATLDGLTYQATPTDNEMPIKPKKDISDDQLRALNTN
jgi:hypothetical protein